MRVTRFVPGLLIAAVIAAASLVLFGGINSPAAAEAKCAKTSPRTGECLIWITVPSNPSDPGDPNNPNAPTGNTGDSGDACWAGEGGQGEKVECRSRYGYWSNQYQCYILKVPQPPPANDPVWQGHEPGDGGIYLCTDQLGVAIPMWIASPPDGPGQQITPLEVAQMAIEQMTMNAVPVGMAPTPVESNAESMGIIGLPVWMWVDNPTATTYATSANPQTESASAGGITVTARAYVERVEWNMGDGSSAIECGQGTPYNKAVHQKKESPDCGYTYSKPSWDQPNHRYTVTASSYWRVDWAGAGQSGTIRLPALVSTVHIRQGELQVLTKD